MAQAKTLHGWPPAAHGASAIDRHRGQVALWGMQTHRVHRQRQSTHRRCASSPGTQLPARAPAIGRAIIKESRTNVGTTVTYTPDAAGRWLTKTSSAPPSVRLGALDALRALYLPAGYPDSVTPDYLAFQLWSVPAHVTGWISVSLTTSSLLKAVGISTGPVGVATTAAAIKWITKDGLGAMGRMVAGSRFGREFDADPQRWRLIAEAISTTGLALEILTAVYPAAFLPLASAGNFTKALARGMVGPVFRVIQTHFAATGNVGAVAAKEEVWDVSGQLAGYAVSLALLKMLEGAGSWQYVVSVWAGFQAVHVWFRYMSLKQLVFPTLNQKRACLLAMAHVGGSALPLVVEGNRLEPLLAAPTDVSPCVHFGVSLEEVVAGPASPGRLDCGDVSAWLAAYVEEEYVMGWHNGAAFVALRQGFGDTALLRAIWQAAWLQQRWAPASHDGRRASLQDVRESLTALSAGFEGFVTEANAAGWDTDRAVIKTGPVTFTTEP